MPLEVLLSNYSARRKPAIPEQSSEGALLISEREVLIRQPDHEQNVRTFTKTYHGT